MTKQEGPRDPLGLGNLIEAGMSSFKWMMIFAILAFVLALTTIGFAIAWCLK